MRELRIYQVDAFTSKVFSGNPAAVMVLSGPLSDAEMQSIASENNLAETAFLLGQGSEWEIRWFTPVHEADFCGHATLASAHVLCTEYGAPAHLRFSTRKVGPLTVQRTSDGYRLDLPAFAPAPTASPAPLHQLFPNGWLQVFQNFENLFVELASAAEVGTFVPDHGLISELTASGLVITARGGHTHDKVPVDFVSRYFAPKAGIPEDPVTGSTHATLVPYWADKLLSRQLLAFQASPRGGLLACEYTGNRVTLSGNAATYLRGNIFLP